MERDWRRTRWRAIRSCRGVVVPALLLALWETGAALGVVPEDTMSRPSAIAVAGSRALTDGSLLLATVQTFQSALIGLALAAVIAIASGVLLGLLPAVEAVVGPTLDAIRPVPAVAIIPLALLIYGFGARMEILVVTFACVWPILIVAISAVRAMEPRLMDIARTLEMPLAARLWRIVLPAVLARIAVGVRVSAGIALVVAVTVEIVLNPQGLGYSLTVAAQSLHPDLMWAELLWVGVTGWAFNRLLTIIDRRWLWRFHTWAAA